MFKIIKDISSVIGLFVVVATILSYANNMYATKVTVRRIRGMISENKSSIKKINKRHRKISAILCGVVIDLNLPTARKECNDIIQSN